MAAMWKTTTGLIIILTGCRAIVARVPNVDRPSPLFTGKEIPEPPQQGKPWLAPVGKVSDKLVRLNEELFKLGFADPRGCEYRVITVTTGSVWTGDGGTVETHGWVLPADAKCPHRFAVCWNALVYPVIKVGPPADLATDIKTAANAARQKKKNYAEDDWPQSDEGWTISHKNLDEARQRAYAEAVASAQRARLAEAQLRKARQAQNAEAIKGLSLTLAVSQTETVMRADRSNAAPVALILTFTNVGDKPVKLDTYDLPYRNFKLTITGPNAKSVRIVDLDQERKRRAPIVEDFPEIRPSGSWFPKTVIDFPGDIGAVSYALLEPGEYRVNAVYANPQVQESVFAAGSWTGSVTSNEIVLNVLPARVLDGKKEQIGESPVAPGLGQLQPDVKEQARADPGKADGAAASTKRFEALVAELPIFQTSEFAAGRVAGTDFATRFMPKKQAAAWRKTAAGSQADSAPGRDGGRQGEDCTRDRHQPGDHH
jgi:hypothetical protein